MIVYLRTTPENARELKDARGFVGATVSTNVVSGDTRIQGAALVTLYAPDEALDLLSEDRRQCIYRVMDASHLTIVRVYIPGRRVLLGLPLASRQRDVVQLVSLGYSNKEIGLMLHIAESSVKTTMRQVMTRLGARDRAHAVRLAIARGYIPLDDEREGSNDA